MKEFLSHLLTFADRTMEGMIGLAFGAMVLVGGLQVFNRYVLSNSLSWSEEFQKYMHIWIVFLAIPLAYKQDDHIGMRVFVNKLPPIIQSVFAVAADLCWLGLGAGMVYYTSLLMKVARAQTSPSMRLRMDLVYFCIVIGGGYLCIMALRKLAGRIGDWKNKMKAKI